MSSILYKGENTFEVDSRNQLLRTQQEKYRPWCSDY